MSAPLLAHLDASFAPPPFEARIAEEVLGPSGATGTPHRKLLEAQNGGFFFGGALHLFGACAAPPWHGLGAWNDPAAWRARYGALAGGLTFFAEDAFGDQFAYTGRGGEVVSFEAELGRVVPAAPTFRDWIDALVEAPHLVLPIDLVAREAERGRRGGPGQHLFAHPPLFSVEAEQGVTIGVVDALEAMRFRGALAAQIHGLPTGTRVKIEIGE